MTDKEFLDYCEAMTETPRCGFVPSNIARLLRLAGHEGYAKQWDLERNYIVDGCHDEVRKYTKEARERMKNQ
jgi:hypothetical protein